MEKSYVKNATGILEEVLLCSPDHIELHPIDVISQKWLENEEELNRKKCIKEHLDLRKVYEENGIKVRLAEARHYLPNQVYARDFGACIKEGIILGRFKEEIRSEETEEYKRHIKTLGVPIIAECTEGYFEGGDFWYLDEKTLAIGVIARTDMEGIENIGKQLEKYGYNIIPVECPEEYLHLDMCFNIVAHKVAVVCKEALPEDFVSLLEEKNFTLIDVPREEVFKHHCNLQSIGNEKVISTKSNVEVNKKLREFGLDVIELELTEILKSGGGPHCMTFPLRRS